MPRQAKSTALPPILRGMAAVLAGMMALCFLVELIPRQRLGLHFQPDNLPFEPYFLADFNVFLERFPYFHSARFFTAPGGIAFMYPAPVAVVYKLFYLLPYPQLGFLLVAGCAFLYACLQFSRLLIARGISVSDAYLFPISILLCSYPFWFVINQGNMELVIWIVVTGGLVFFLQGRGYSAAACFAIAGSMKIYPVIYLGLLLNRKQYRQIFFGTGVLVVTTLVSLWLLCPDIAASWRGVSESLDVFRTVMMLHVRPDTKVDHSLFSLIKLRVAQPPFSSIPARTLSLYLATVAIGGVLLFFLRIRLLPITNQILCLTIASILLPPTSYEYTLLHLFLPLAMVLLLLLDAQRSRRQLSGIKAMVICFTILLSFLPEFIYQGRHYGGQIKAVTLLVLFVLALWKPLPGWDGAAPEKDSSESRVDWSAADVA